MTEPTHIDQSVATKTFQFEWGGTAALTVEEIWPDGDAPENPTVDDVLAQVRKAGSLWQLASEWNLDLQGVEVNGRDSGLR